MASCSACSVRSSSSIPYGLPKPLDSRRSDSFATRSSRSRSSSSSPVYFVYLYFMLRATIGDVVNWRMREFTSLIHQFTHSPIPQFSVVILLLPRRNPNLVVDRRLLAPRRAARRGFRGGVAALVGAADLLLCTKALEDEIDRRRDERSWRAARQAGFLRQIEKPLHAARLRDHLVGRRAVAERQRSAEIEPLDDRPRVHAVEHAGEHRSDGRPNQVARHLLGATQLALVLQFELAGDGRQRGVDVGDARHDERLAVGQGAALCVGYDQLQRRDR